MRLINIARYGLLIMSAPWMSAAPRLRLSQWTNPTIDIAQGTNPPSSGSGIVTVTNIGDGQLNLTVASSVPWMSGAYGLAGQNGCSAEFGPCISVTYNTASLAPGLYTGLLTVSDPNALDTPQTLTVTVNIGATLPSAFSLYAPPSTSVYAYFTVIGPLNYLANVNWLSLIVGEPITGAVSQALPLQVTADATGLAVGDYPGSFTLSSSNYSPDNMTANVDLHVTTSPITDTLGASPVTNPPLSFTASLPAGPNAAQTQKYWIANDGLGTLAVSGISTATNTGAWLSAVPFSGTGGVGVAITANPTALTAGIYTGTVTVNSNAANSPTVIPVSLNVVAQGTPPAIIWPQIVNAANDAAQEAVAPGDIVAVEGVGLLEGDPITITSFPLPTQVGSGNTQVLVNGVAAPIFYASYGQITIQIPYETSVAQDAQIQVVRGGISSPIGTVPMAASAPQILQFGCPFVNDCDYQNNAIGINFSDGSFPLPVTAPFPNSHPAKVGDVITFYGVGFGQTRNPLSDGVAAPASPLPTSDPSYQFCFGMFPGDVGGFCTPTSYSGASPGSAGLYQINVTIPQGAGTGFVYITNGTSYSDPVWVTVQ
jgi:uncharacterized protein (TIGR03437 family)